ncbi:MAG TPA: alpha/beta fold hydrolase [Ktedonobacterales bacterium]|jgi:pimeloyl-ACP methyl ester carboxylesterase|nr:alpha/beta fold hydrolase [Ktedonobacterales bacterium]
MPTAQINDIQMCYEIPGEGAPLALVLGRGTDLSEWGNIIERLAQRHRVIAFDNRGAGRTDKPDQPYTAELMAEHIAGLLRAIGLRAARVAARPGLRWRETAYLSSERTRQAV